MFESCSMPPTHATLAQWLVFPDRSRSFCGRVSFGVEVLLSSQLAPAGAFVLHVPCARCGHRSQSPALPGAFLPQLLNCLETMSFICLFMQSDKLQAPDSCTRGCHLRKALPWLHFVCTRRASCVLRRLCKCALALPVIQACRTF